MKPMSLGSICGLIVGLIILIGILCGILFWLCRKKHRHLNKKSSTNANAPIYMSNQSNTFGFVNAYANPWFVHSTNHETTSIENDATYQNIKDHLSTNQIYSSHAGSDSGPYRFYLTQQQQQQQQEQEQHQPKPPIINTNPPSNQNQRLSIINFLNKALAIGLIKTHLFNKVRQHSPWKRANDDEMDIVQIESNHQLYGIHFVDQHTDPNQRNSVESKTSSNWMEIDEFGSLDNDSYLYSIESVLFHAIEPKPSKSHSKFVIKDKRRRSSSSSINSHQIKSPDLAKPEFYKPAKFKFPPPGPPVAGWAIVQQQENSTESKPPQINRRLGSDQHLLLSRSPSTSNISKDSRLSIVTTESLAAAYDVDCPETSLPDDCCSSKRDAMFLHEYSEMEQSTTAYSHQNNISSSAKFPSSSKLDSGFADSSLTAHLPAIHRTQSIPSLTSKFYSLWLTTNRPQSHSSKFLCTSNQSLPHSSFEQSFRKVEVL